MPTYYDHIEEVQALEAEIERLRAALQKIADQDFDDNMGRDASVLAGFAWASLEQNVPGID